MLKTIKTWRKASGDFLIYTHLCIVFWMINQSINWLKIRGALIKNIRIIMCLRNWKIISSVLRPSVIQRNMPVPLVIQRRKPWEQHAGLLAATPVFLFLQLWFRLSCNPRNERNSILLTILSIGLFIGSRSHKLEIYTSLFVSLCYQLPWLMQIINL